MPLVQPVSRMVWPLSCIERSLPFSARRPACGSLKHALADDRGLQYFLAPVAEAGGGGGLRSARHGVVETVVLGGRHVSHALCHRFGHAELEKPGLVSLEGDLLEADRPTQHFRHDLRHVVEGQVLVAEYGNVAASAPGVIEKQRGSYSGAVAGGARSARLVRGDRGDKHLLARYH